MTESKSVVATSVISSAANNNNSDAFYTESDTIGPTSTSIGTLRKKKIRVVHVAVEDHVNNLSTLRTSIQAICDDIRKPSRYDVRKLGLLETNFYKKIDDTSTWQIILDMYTKLAKNYNELQYNRGYNYRAIILLAHYINHQCIQFCIRPLKIKEDVEECCRHIRSLMRTILFDSPEKQAMVMLKTNMVPTNAFLLIILCTEIREKIRKRVLEGTSTVILINSSLLLFNLWYRLMSNDNERKRFNTNCEDIVNELKKFRRGVNGHSEFYKMFDSRFKDTPVEDLYQKQIVNRHMIDRFFVATMDYWKNPTIDRVANTKSTTISPASITNGILTINLDDDSDDQSTTFRAPSTINPILTINLDDDDDDIVEIIDDPQQLIQPTNTTPSTYTITDTSQLDSPLSATNCTINQGSLGGELISSENCILSNSVSNSCETDLICEQVLHSVNQLAIPEKPNSSQIIDLPTTVSLQVNNIANNVDHNLDDVEKIVKLLHEGTHTKSPTLLNSIQDSCLVISNPPDLSNNNNISVHNETMSEITYACNEVENVLSPSHLSNNVSSDISSCHESTLSYPMDTESSSEKPSDTCVKDAKPSAALGQQLTLDPNNSSVHCVDNNNMELLPKTNTMSRNDMESRIFLSYLELKDCTKSTDMLEEHNTIGEEVSHTIQIQERLDIVGPLRNEIALDEHMVSSKTNNDLTLKDDIKSLSPVFDKSVKPQPMSFAPNMSNTLLESVPNPSSQSNTEHLENAVQYVLPPPSSPTNVAENLHCTLISNNIPIEDSSTLNDSNTKSSLSASFSSALDNTSAITESVNTISVALEPLGCNFSVIPKPSHMSNVENSNAGIHQPDYTDFTQASSDVSLTETSCSNMLLDNNIIETAMDNDNFDKPIDSICNIISANSDKVSELITKLPLESDVLSTSMPETEPTITTKVTVSAECENNIEAQNSDFMKTSIREEITNSQILSSSTEPIEFHLVHNEHSTIIPTDHTRTASMDDLKTKTNVPSSASLSPCIEIYPSSADTSNTHLNKITASNPTSLSTSIDLNPTSVFPSNSSNDSNSMALNAKTPSMYSLNVGSICLQNENIDVLDSTQIQASDTANENVIQDSLTTASIVEHDKTIECPLMASDTMNMSANSLLIDQTIKTDSLVTVSQLSTPAFPILMHECKPDESHNKDVGGNLFPLSTSCDDVAYKDSNRSKLLANEVYNIADLCSSKSNDTGDISLKRMESNLTDSETVIPSLIVKIKDDLIKAPLKILNCEDNLPSNVVPTTLEKEIIILPKLLDDKHDIYGDGENTSQLPLAVVSSIIDLPSTNTIDLKSFTAEPDETVTSKSKTDHSQTAPKNCVNSLTKPPRAALPTHLSSIATANNDRLVSIDEKDSNNEVQNALLNDSLSTDVYNSHTPPTSASLSTEDSTHSTSSDDNSIANKIAPPFSDFLYSEIDVSPFSTSSSENQLHVNVLNPSSTLSPLDSEPSIYNSSIENNDDSNITSRFSSMSNDATPPISPTTFETTTTVRPKSYSQFFLSRHAKSGTLATKTLITKSRIQEDHTAKIRVKRFRRTRKPSSTITKHNDMSITESSASVLAYPCSPRNGPIVQNDLVTSTTTDPDIGSITPGQDLNISSMSPMSADGSVEHLIVPSVLKTTIVSTSTSANRHRHYTESKSATTQVPHKVETIEVNISSNSLSKRLELDISQETTVRIAVNTNGSFCKDENNRVNIKKDLSYESPLVENITSDEDFSDNEEEEINVPSTKIQMGSNRIGIESNGRGTPLVDETDCTMEDECPNLGYIDRSVYGKIRPDNLNLPVERFDPIAYYKDYDSTSPTVERCHDSHRNRNEPSSRYSYRLSESSRPPSIDESRRQYLPLSRHEEKYETKPDVREIRDNLRLNRHYTDFSKDEESLSPRIHVALKSEFSSSKPQSRVNEFPKEQFHPASKRNSLVEAEKGLLMPKIDKPTICDQTCDNSPKLLELPVILNSQNKVVSEKIVKLSNIQDDDLIQSTGINSDSSCSKSRKHITDSNQNVPETRTEIIQNPRVKLPVRSKKPKSVGKVPANKCSLKKIDMLLEMKEATSPSDESSNNNATEIKEDCQSPKIPDECKTKNGNLLKTKNTHFDQLPSQNSNLLGHEVSTKSNASIHSVETNTDTSPHCLKSNIKTIYPVISVHTPQESTAVEEPSVIASFSSNLYTKKIVPSVTYFERSVSRPASSMNDEIPFELLQPTKSTSHSKDLDSSHIFGTLPNPIEVEKIPENKNGSKDCKADTLDIAQSITEEVVCESMAPVENPFQTQIQSISKTLKSKRPLKTKVKAQSLSSESFLLPPSAVKATKPHPTIVSSSFFSNNTLSGLDILADCSLLAESASVTNITPSQSVTNIVEGTHSPPVVLAKSHLYNTNTLSKNDLAILCKLNKRKKINKNALKKLAIPFEIRICRLSERSLQKYLRSTIKSELIEPKDDSKCKLTNDCHRSSSTLEDGSDPSISTPALDETLASDDSPIPSIDSAIFHQSAAHIVSHEEIPLLKIKSVLFEPMEHIATPLSSDILSPSIDGYELLSQQTSISPSKPIKPFSICPTSHISNFTIPEERPQSQLNSKETLSTRKDLPTFVCDSILPLTQLTSDLDLIDSLDPLSDLYLANFPMVIGHAPPVPICQPDRLLDNRKRKIANIEGGTPAKQPNLSPDPWQFEISTFVKFYNKLSNFSEDEKSLETAAKSLLADLPHRPEDTVMHALHGLEIGFLRQTIRKLKRFECEKLKDMEEAMNKCDVSFEQMAEIVAMYGELKSSITNLSATDEVDLKHYVEKTDEFLEAWSKVIESIFPSAHRGTIDTNTLEDESDRQSPHMSLPGLDDTASSEVTVSAIIENLESFFENDTYNGLQNANSLTQMLDLDWFDDNPPDAGPRDLVKNDGMIGSFPKPSHVNGRNFQS